MKSFKNYAKTSTESGSGENVESTMKAEELAKRLLSAYSGKSSGDIWQSILSEAEKSKRAGTLSNEEIEKFYQSFSPMLDGNQRKTLRAVVDRLKSI